MMEMSAVANSQGMESLDAGVFTYTELDPVTNGFYQQIISKKMLSQCLGQTHQGEIGRSDGSRQCIQDRTSHSGRREDWGKYEVQTDYETLTVGS